MLQNSLERPIRTDNGREHRPEASIPGNPIQEDLRKFKAQLHHRLVVGMDLVAFSSMTREELRQKVRQVAEELCQRSPSLLNRQERERLVNQGLDEALGLGPRGSLVNCPALPDILINGA